MPPTNILYTEGQLDVAAIMCYNNSSNLL